MQDKNEVELKPGDTIDLHQTVNGQSLFIVQSVEPLEIVYHHNPTRHYEYDKHAMLAPDRYTGETTWEIIIK